nr:putative reverse transcriptase domain-containing protein [Tanacetum cinerariifolium]
MLRVCVMDFGKGKNSTYLWWSSPIVIAITLISMLHSLKLSMAKNVDRLFVGLRLETLSSLVQKLFMITTEKIIQIKKRIQVVRDRKKSYTDRRRKPLEFEVGDKVMLKVSPWKRVIRFGKRGKLNPCYIGPFKIITKKCFVDEPLTIPLDEIQIDDKLNFIEEPVENMDREVKRLKQCHIPIMKYNTSITKTKVARYEIVGIECMVPMLWTTTKVGYDKDVEKGIKHWGERLKLWYRSQMNKFSKHNVYSTKKILSVVILKEGDFVDLHMNDIEDMLLLAVQHKLFQLDGGDIVDLIVALLMFTRSLIIKRQVEDLQLCADELYKFLDGTLKTVRDELHHRILAFRLGYKKEMFRRKWTAIEKRRSELIVELIDKHIREWRIIRNLKRLAESNGTVLSTNWKEVGPKMVEGTPPDGMEMKIWEY